MAAEAAAAAAAREKQIKATALPVAATAAQKAATGAIIGQKRTIKVKNPSGAPTGM
jgi:hypothetical protein